LTGDNNNDGDDNDKNNDENHDDNDKNNDKNNDNNNDNGRGIISTSQDFHQKSRRGFGLKILNFFSFLAKFSANCFL